MLLKAGTYFVNPQVNSGGQVGIVVKVDNITIRGEGAQNTSIIANGQINDYGTVILFGHRTGSSDASFNVQNVTADALKGSTTIQVANASGYVVGDVITTAISLWLVREARALGAPWHITARMLGNVAVDGVIGLVPVAGDAFDVMFRANVRNVRMLKNWLDRHPR